MEVSTEVLRKQVMIGQFVNAVGCSPDEATQILTSARWQLEVALTLFFQGHSVTSPPTSQHHSTATSTSTTTNTGTSAGSSLGSRMSYQACVPTNTPATPPQFPDTLAAFAQLQASSPAETSASASLLQEPTIVHCQTQASKS